MSSSVPFTLTPLPTFSLGPLALRTIFLKAQKSPLKSNEEHVEHTSPELTVAWPLPSPTVTLAALAGTCVGQPQLPAQNHHASRSVTIVKCANLRQTLRPQPWGTAWRVQSKV